MAGLYYTTLCYIYYTILYSTGGKRRENERTNERINLLIDHDDDDDDGGGDIEFSLNISERNEI